MIKLNHINLKKGNATKKPKYAKKVSESSEQKKYGLWMVILAEKQIWLREGLTSAGHNKG